MEIRMFDEGFFQHEQFPRRMVVCFRNERSGVTVDLLSDRGLPINIRKGEMDWNPREADGYRYRLVFHLAYMTYLHWSPVMRDLMGLKRRSNRLLEKAVDGPRQLIVEEGIASYVFTRARECGFFIGAQSIAEPILLTVKRLAQFSEIKDAPIANWEQAILGGFGVWRELRSSAGGQVSLDLATRTIHAS